MSGEGGGVTVSFSCNDFGTLKSTDVGALLGAGLEFPVGRQAIIVGARYDFGLIGVGDVSSEKNRNLQFLAGVRF